MTHHREPYGEFSGRDDPGFRKAGTTIWIPEARLQDVAGLQFHICRNKVGVRIIPKLCFRLPMGNYGLYHLLNVFAISQDFQMESGRLTNYVNS